MPPPFRSASSARRTPVSISPAAAGAAFRRTEAAAVSRTPLFSNQRSPWRARRSVFPTCVAWWPFTASAGEPAGPAWPPSSPAKHLFSRCPCLQRRAVVAAAASRRHRQSRHPQAAGGHLTHGTRCTFFHSENPPVGLERLKSMLDEHLTGKISKRGRKLVLLERPHLLYHMMAC